MWRKNSATTAGLDVDVAAFLMEAIKFAAENISQPPRGIICLLL